MEGSISPETLQTRRKTVINTQATFVVSGKSWATGDDFDSEADKGCVGMALGRSTRCHRCQGQGPYAQQIVIGVAKHRQTYKNMRAYR